MQNSIDDIVTSLKLNDDFRNKYIVKDLIGPNTKILLLLESPHEREIICKYPAAGDTGLEISKYLLNGINSSMGEYVFDNLDKVKFGIMNCCQIPMQKSLYSGNYNKKIIDAFTTIRSTNIDVVRRRDDFVQIVDDKIYKDLENRLSRVLHNKIVLIIPCGKMANYFINKYSLPNSVKIRENISHPAHNHWHNNTEIRKLKSEIDEILKG